MLGLLLTLRSHPLGGPPRAGPDLGHLTGGGVVGGTVGGLRDGGHEVARGRRGLVGVDDWVGHGAHTGHALHVLVGEVRLPLLLALGQRHIEGLGGHNAAVHLRHRLGGLLR